MAQKVKISRYFIDTGSASDTLKCCISTQHLLAFNTAISFGAKNSLSKIDLSLMEISLA